jgi:hypothetical protein
MDYPIRKKRMRGPNKWEIFANKNAEFYVLTHSGVDYSKIEGKEYFFK